MQDAGNREGELWWLWEVALLLNSSFNLCEEEYLRTNMAICFCLLDPFPLGREPWSLPPELPDLRCPWNMERPMWNWRMNMMNVWGKDRWLKMSDSTEGKNPLSSATLLWYEILSQLLNKCLNREPMVPQRFPRSVWATGNSHFCPTWTANRDI